MAFRKVKAAFDITFVSRWSPCLVLLLFSIMIGVLAPAVGAGSATRIWNRFLHAVPGHPLRNPRSKTLQELYQQPIDFTGIVTDEKNAPVEGAFVHFEALDSTTGGHTDYAAETDHGGFFRGPAMRGRALLVTVAKEGYYTIPFLSDGFFVHEGPEPSMHWKLMPQEAGTPAAFVLRARTPAARLEHILEKKATLGKQGDPVAINLSTGAEAADGQGDLVFAMKVRDNPAPDFYHYDWSVNIRVPGGGIISRLDAYNFTAPTAGYGREDTIEFAATMEPNQWRDTAERDYFLKTESGNYARVKLTFSPRRGGSMVIVESFMNPSGEPNLDSGVLPEIHR